VPATAALVFVHLQERRLLTAMVEGEGRNLVRLLGTAEQVMLAGTQQMLRLFADSERGIGRDAAGCRRRAADQLREQAVYINLGYVDAEGRLVCSATAMAEGGDFSERRWFREARAGAALPTGDYAVSRLGGGRSITYGHPMTDASGRFAGVAFAVVDPSWIARLLETMELPEGVKAGVLDTRGQALALHPDPEARAGSDYREAALAGTLSRRPDRGNARVTAEDGAERVHAYAPMAVAGRDLYHVVTVMPEAALATVEGAFRRGLAWFALLALAAAAVAWVGTERLVLRRIREMGGFAGRIASGDFAVHGAVAKGGSELDRLAAQLDALAQGLRTREIERDRASDALRESEERFRAFMNHSPTVSWIVDSDGRVVYGSESFAYLTRTSEESPIGRSIFELFERDIAREFERNNRRVLESGEVHRTTELAPRADGSIGTYLVYKFPLGAAHEKLVGGVAIDITERVRIEEELMRSEASLVNAQRIANFGNWELDIRTGRYRWSAQLRRIFGVESGRVDGGNDWFMQSVDAADRARVAAARAAAKAGKAALDIEYHVAPPGGGLRIVREVGDLTTDGDGRPWRLDATVQDVTESKRVLEELERARARLLAMSKKMLEAHEQEERALARELHEQIGQLLTATLLCAQSLREAVGGGRGEARLADMVGLLQQAVDRVRGMTYDLRPAQLDDFGLEAALRSEADRRARAGGFLLHIRLATGGHRFPDSIEHACFRVVQQALNGIVRFSHAGNVWLELDADDTALSLEIRDDGVGFDPAAADGAAWGGPHIGALGMEERVALVGGVIQIVAKPGVGTRVAARFPLQASGTAAQG
jgi:PAS domain S-box-containing protein